MIDQSGEWLMYVKLNTRWMMDLIYQGRKKERSKDNWSILRWHEDKSCHEAKWWLRSTVVKGSSIRLYSPCEEILTNEEQYSDNISRKLKIL